MNDLNQDKYDWTLPVDRWPEEQLNVWATNILKTDFGAQPDPNLHPRQIEIWTRKFFSSSATNIQKAEDNSTKVRSTSATKPVTDWTIDDVAVWAQKEGKLDEEDRNVLMKAKVDGAALLVIPNVKRLEDYGLPPASADKLWAAIIQLEPNPLKKFILEVYQKLVPSPVSDNNVCQICKLPLEPSKEPLPECEQMKHSPNAVQSSHLFCLPDELIFNREVATEQLQGALTNNVKVFNSFTKQDHIFCTVFGFVGIGKTTVGQRVARKLCLNERPVKYIYIDFSNGDNVDPNTEDDCNAFTSQLALRIVTRLFTNLSYEHARARFPKQLKQLEDSFKYPMPLTQILQTWEHKSEYPALVLHFDEVNYLSDCAREHIVAYVGSAMVPQADSSNISPVLPILPLLSGTTESMRATIKLSKFANTAVSLSALSDEAQYSLVLGSIDNHWRQHDLKFKMLIKSTLGVPRLVMQLRQAVIEQFRESAIPVWDELLNAIANKFLHYVGQTYSKSEWKSVFPSQTLLLRLLCVCLRGKLTSDTDEKGTFSAFTVPGIETKMKSIPVQSLQDGGFIHTADTSDSNGQLDILMPYCLLSALISSVDTYLSIEDAIVAPISNLVWQELEHLELHFLQLFVKVFNAMQPNLSVKFSDIWRGAVAQADILEMKITIPSNDSFCTGEEKSQWITKQPHTICNKLPYVHLADRIINLSDTNGVFLACAGNPLFDVRTKFEIDTSIQPEENHPFEPVQSGANPRHRSIGSGTAPNKAPNLGPPKTKLLNLVQMKASADSKPKITASNIFTWYNKVKVLEFPEDYKVVFTYFTNKNMEWDINEQNVQWTQDTLLASCPNLVLMSRDQLVTYLSPMFAPLCLPKD